MSSLPAPSRSNLRRKLLVGFGLVFLLLVIIATISVQSTRGFIRTASWVADAHEAIEIEERLLRNLSEMESASRNYLFTGALAEQRAREGAKRELGKSLGELQSLISADARRTGSFRELQGLLAQYLARDEEQARARARSATAAAIASPETDKLLQQIRLLLLQAQNDERNVLAERSDLQERISRSTISAVMAGGGLTIIAMSIAALLILRDLTARHRAEEALAQEHNLLSSIINAMPNYVYVKDAKGRFILDNSAHRLYLGLGEEHSVEGRTVYDYFSSSIAAGFDADDKQVIQTGEAILSKEEVSLPANGEQREMWLETNRVAIRDTDGKIVGLVGVSSDISARKADEEKLRHFASQLERSNSELQNFASVASHDLQEPLRKIRAFGDRLRARCAAGLGEQGLDYVARMENAAQRMQTLIQDLLKLSRVTSRQQPFVPCDLGEIVRQVLGDLEIAIEQGKATIEVGELPTIDADPIHMRQLFQNLIANALKFQKPGEAAEVSISGRTFEMLEPLLPAVKIGERVCQLRVTDNGIGFDEQFAEQIFVVFQRLHTRDEYAGTGIGLAVCRKITDRHGGTIVAKSAPGQGASFIITLPLKQSIAPPHE